MPAVRTGEGFRYSVLDLDRKDGKDGFKALRAKGIDPDALSWVIVETISGGWHLWFEHPPGLRCSVGQEKDGLAGVDVRADRGYVVAPGASNARGSYRFIKGDLDDLALGAVPDWPADLPLQARVRSGESAGQAEPSGLSFAALRDALMTIPVSTREEHFGTDLAWFKVARIIYDETGGSEDGNALWHEWSEGWGKYDYHVAESKWNRDEAYDGDPATVWTILKVARKGGWSHPDFVAWEHAIGGADFPDDELDDETKAMIGLPSSGTATSLAESNWQIGTPMMDRDKPIMNQHNAIVFLARNADSVLPALSRNLMTGRDEWRGGPLTESDLVLTHAAMNRFGLKTIGKEMVKDAIGAVAKYRQHHPIRDALDGVNHDGVARLDTWLVRHAGAEDSPYIRAVGRKWLIAMVARVFIPGCKHDHMPVLIGPQGVRKSTLCRLLAGDAYFSDSLPSVGGNNQEAEKHLSGKWLVEVAEMQAMNKSEGEDIKAFVSGQTDNVRRAYSRFDEPTPRQCVFVGTTNEDQFLQDATGGRRFWPIHVGKIDTDAIAAERDQLFAEAVAAFKAGEAWWLDPDFEAEHAVPMQEAARLQDSWADPIAEWLDTQHGDFGENPTVTNEVTVTEIMEQALSIPTGQQHQTLQKRVAAVMRGLGWDKVKSHGLMVWRRKQVAQ